MRTVTECMATAANPAKGGFVREALINSYPRLAAMMEDMLQKLRRDTEVRLYSKASAASEKLYLAFATCWACNPPFLPSALGLPLERPVESISWAFSPRPVPAGMPRPSAAILVFDCARSHQLAA